MPPPGSQDPTTLVKSWCPRSTHPPSPQVAGFSAPYRPLPASPAPASPALASPAPASPALASPRAARRLRLGPARPGVARSARLPRSCGGHGRQPHKSPEVAAIAAHRPPQPRRPGPQSAAAPAHLPPPPEDRKITRSSLKSCRVGLTARQPHKSREVARLTARHGSAAPTRPGHGPQDPHEFRGVVPVFTARHP
jgi:hypothetical protein